MSLVEELQSLDVSRIVSAKGAISIAINDPELKKLIESGATQSALAGLGGALGELRQALPDASALARPLANGLTSLGGEITERVPIDRYLGAVRDGAEFVGRFVENFTGDVASLGKHFGLGLGDAVKLASSVVDGFSSVSLQDLPRFRDLIATVEAGVPGDPAAFTRVAIDILLPFQTSDLTGLRSIMDGVHAGLGGLALPRDRTAGLQASLRTVIAAASNPDDAVMRRALDDLARVRANTIGQLNEDLRGVVALLGRVHVPDLFGGLKRFEGSLRKADRGILEFLGEWRVLLVEARQQVAAMDMAILKTLIPGLLSELERFAKELIGDPMDAAVAEAGDALRSAFRRLGLRAARNEITGFLVKITNAIRNARIDRFAIEARAKLATLSSTLGGAGGLPAEIRAELERIQAVIDKALDGVLDALEKIRVEVDAVAGEAQDILGRAATAVEAFQGAMSEIARALDELGIEKSAEQVVQTLETIRETAQKLLGDSPLPDSMRPLVEQLIATLEAIDFDVVFAPVNEALTELELPPEVAGNITAALAATRDAAANLIPAKLVAEIDAEVKSVLEVVKRFEPAKLLPDVTSYLQETAEYVRQLRLSEDLVETARGPFKFLLDGIDAANPDRLLAPVVEAYDAVLGRIETPSPDRLASGFNGLLEKTGEAASRSIGGPAATFTGGQPTSARGAAAGAPRTEAGTSTVDAVQSLGDSFRPGDIIRMFGYLPDRLRETLKGVEARAAQTIVGTLDAHCGGLARDLRALPQLLRGVESEVEMWLRELFAPLRQLHFEAVLAVDSRRRGSSASASLSLQVVATASPGALGDDVRETVRLLRIAVRKLTEGPGSPGQAIESAAHALERCSISALGADLDRWLAALDIEPIAAEFDALVAAIINKTPELVGNLEDELNSAVERFKTLIDEFNPGAQLQKFARLFDIVEEELDLLNPRRLAAELGEIHAAIRSAVAAYDPAVFAADINQVIESAAQGILSLNPQALLGDVSFLGATVARVEQANPATALAAVGASLKEVGERLAKVDPGALLEEVNELLPRVSASAHQAVEKIRNEILRLLKSLEFAAANARVSVDAAASEG